MLDLCRISAGGILWKQRVLESQIVARYQQLALKKLPNRFVVIIKYNVIFLGVFAKNAFRFLDTSNIQSTRNTASGSSFLKVFPTLQIFCEVS